MPDLVDLMLKMEATSVHSEKAPFDFHMAILRILANPTLACGLPFCPSDVLRSSGSAKHAHMYSSTSKVHSQAADYFLRVSGQRKLQRGPWGLRKALKSSPRSGKRYNGVIIETFHPILGIEVTRR